MFSDNSRRRTSFEKKLRSAIERFSKKNDLNWEKQLNPTEEISLSGAKEAREELGFQTFRREDVTSCSKPKPPLYKIEKKCFIPRVVLIKEGEDSKNLKAIH